VLSFCEKHGIPKLGMDHEYINRHKPRQRTNRTNYQHYRYDCLNPVIDLQLIEFNDRFNEVNSELLTHMAAFSPNNSFCAFKHESLMELAKAYPDDFSPGELDDLSSELHRYIDNVRADARFAQLGTISEHGKLMVDIKKHLAFPLVYRLLKLVLVLPIATASVERSFSAMKIVKTVLRNRIGDDFMNVSVFRDRGVPGPTSEMSLRAPAQMGRREAEREGGGGKRQPETGVRELEIPRPSCSSRAQVGCACSRGLQASTRERERAASRERLSRPRARAANPL
jgi:hypothetical protein